MKHFFLFPALCVLLILASPLKAQKHETLYCSSEPDTYILVPNVSHSIVPDIYCGSTAEVVFTIYTYAEPSSYVRSQYASFIWPQSFVLPNGWQFVKVVYVGKESSNGLDFYKYNIHLKPDAYTGGAVTFRKVFKCSETEYLYAQDYTVNITRKAYTPQLSATANSLTVCGSQSQTVSVVNPQPGHSYTWTSTNSNTQVVPSADGLSASISGIGSFQVTASACGSVSSPYVVNVYGVSNPGSIFAESLIRKIQCSIDEVPGASSYNWYKDGVKVISNGSNLVSFPVYDTDCGNSFYIQVEAVFDGCGVSSRNTTWATYECEDGKSLSYSVQVYPNPATSKITVKALGKDRALEARLYDQYGQLKKVASSDSGDFEMGVLDLPDGTYYLHLINSIKTYTQQVIIKK
ncbi:T9SS type A sorting domain-containing protein [Pontibacter cellulosilyticus]|uniref:T9SS type A sorting domain-containing protein n=1 Tax=Pontibacter cellulosilyticus TaxID=1720253 RepID=A0A923NBR5_9BACT|nr:T9SS type A sorting domain-containing protein [Pontibacter cellulosilyticus]MBC5994010.1 T9SS type A sorting domain-containing protein [Pontibacter cellulosilyticus]